MFVLGAFLFKAQCLAGAGWDGRQYARGCYNDIQPLYTVRAVDRHVFPYIHGELNGSELANGAIEYPVLTGVFMWASGLLVDNDNAYLRVSALLLAPFALMVAHLLARMAGARALMWAAAPALILYAFHNWDLLVVAAAVSGFYLWWRGKPLWAAVAFGIGAAFKMYPILFLAPLTLDVIRRAGFKRGLAAATAGAGTTIAINLPFMLLNPSGWTATYAFHSQRTANYDSIWGVGWAQASPEALNTWTAALTGVFVIAALAYGWLRADREGAFDFLAVSGALLAAFLLWNKVHSPQYTLWLLPLLVLVRVHIAWWVAYAIADLAVYFGVFRWFYDYLYLGSDETFAKTVMNVGVFVRAALLLALFVVFLRSRGIALGEQPQERTADRADSVTAPSPA